jgi:hypothetical protein
MLNLFVRSPDALEEPARELNSVMKAGVPAKAVAEESMLPINVVIDKAGKLTVNVPCETAKLPIDWRD